MINIKRGRPDIHIWPEGLREFKKCLKIKSHAVACVLAFMQYKNISAIRICYVSNHSNALNFPYILPSRTVQLKFRIVSTELRNTNTDTNNQKIEKSFEKKQRFQRHFANESRLLSSTVASLIIRMQKYRFRRVAPWKN